MINWCIYYVYEDDSARVWMTDRIITMTTNNQYPSIVPSNGTNELFAIHREKGLFRDKSRSNHP